MNVSKKASVNAKLKPVDAVHIKSLKYNCNGAELARQYNVSPATIYSIWQGRTWKQMT